MGVGVHHDGFMCACSGKDNVWRVRPRCGRAWWPRDPPVPSLVPPPRSAHTPFTDATLVDNSSQRGALQQSRGVAYKEGGVIAGSAWIRKPTQCAKDIVKLHNAT